MRIRRHLRSQHYLDNHRVIDESLRNAVWLFLDAGITHDAPMRTIQQIRAYALLYNRDLSCIFEDLDDSPSPTHTNLYCRLILLLANECFAKVPVLIGKELREAMETWETPQGVRDKVSQCGRNFSRLRKAEAEWVHELRNNVLAHRDLAIAKQWRLINDLDVDRAQGVATHLIQWTTSLYEVITDVVDARVAHLRDRDTDA